MCLKKKSVETILLLQEVFGNEFFGVSTIKRGHKMFLDAGEFVEFEPQGGNPNPVCSVMNINIIATTIEKDCHQSV